MGRPSDAKEKLLQVAFDLIWNQSYSSVSVDHICERARVNKGSFYHFFPSKSDLAVEAYEVHWREKQPELDRIFSPQIPHWNGLRLWCKHVWERQKQKGDAVWPRLRLSPMPAWAPELATQGRKDPRQGPGIDGSQPAIRGERASRCPTGGGLISIDPHSGAKRIYSTALGLLLYAKIHNDLKVLDELEPASDGYHGRQGSWRLENQDD